MSGRQTIARLVKIEQDIRRLRLCNAHAKWFGVGMRGLEEHAKGLRLSLEGIMLMTEQEHKPAPDSKEPS